MAGERIYRGDVGCQCGKDAPIFQTAGGMLTYSCGWCRVQVHAPKGSPAFRALESKIKAGIDESKPKVKTVEHVEHVEKPKEVEKTIFDFLKG